VTGNHVHDNVVAIAPQPGDGSDAYAVAWLADWTSPMFTPDAVNHGENDAAALVGTASGAPFAWDGDVADPDAFRATPGGQGLVVLEPADTRQRLAAAGVPMEPVARVVNSESSRRELIGRILPPLALAAGLLLLLAIGVLVVRRRRRRDRAAMDQPPV
jgi:LPXTG-motif cell wall-anchored protein